MHNLNLGILAHVDAGKTSLTERLLHAAGIIDEIGRVDRGNTRTDSLQLERERGITIRSAVVSFAVDDLTVNLVDTPGHSDFIAEVERALSVLDGAVLVVSAVEGVQAQTRVLMRALQRLEIPTLIFVNKVDRTGADHERVLQEIRQKLTNAAFAFGVVDDVGTRQASVSRYRSIDEIDPANIDLLAELDDILIDKVLDDGLTLDDVIDALQRQTRRAQVCPVMFGSAITGAGCRELMSSLAMLAPPNSSQIASQIDEELSAVVFKIEHDTTGRKVIARMLSGALRVRDAIRIGEAEHKVTALLVFESGTTRPVDRVHAGQMACIVGLSDVRIGEFIGKRPERKVHRFIPPTLETIVTSANEDRAALYVALSKLAEQDPLIGLRRDEVHGEIALSLYGEVQKEVIAETVIRDYGIAGLTFGKTTTICIERVVGTGFSLEVDPQPFLGTVGLRVDPAPMGSGNSFRLEVEYGSLRLSFHKAVEETVSEVLRQGLYGWEVTDCVVTMTHSGYWPRQSHAHAKFDKSMSSTAGDFRLLTPLVLMSALKEAGTKVCEPIHRFRLEVPAVATARVVNHLFRAGAIVDSQTVERSAALLEGFLPAERVDEVQQWIPSATSGEGVWESTFDSYRPVIGRPPSRDRSDLNPLDRIEYLRNVALLR